MALRVSSVQSSRFLKMLFIVFKVSGVATMSIHKDMVSRKRIEQPIFKFSFLGTVYKVLLIGVVIALNAMRIPSYYDAVYRDRSRINQIIDACQTFFSVSFAIPILIFGCRHQKTLIQLGNKLSSIERNLRLNYEYSRGPVIKFIAFFLSLNFLLWSILIIVSLICSLEYIAPFAFIVPVIAINFLVIQYILILRFVFNMFKATNDSLLNSDKTATLNNRTISMEIRVSSLRKVHLSLCDVSRELSEMYAFPILGCVIFMFISILYCSYYFAYNVLKNFPLPLLIDVCCTDYFFIHSSCIIALTRCVSLIVQEVTFSIVATYGGNVSSIILF